jgi:subtilase family serine protease
MRESIPLQREKSLTHIVFPTIQLALLLATIGALAAPASGALKTLPRHRPELPPGLVSHGKLASTMRLRLAIGLPLSDARGLDDFLSQVYDPANTNFHRYLTPEEFTRRFGPSDADYQAVLAFARTNGFEITMTHSNRLLLDVEGNAADIERAFHVNLLTYAHPTEPREFFAPDSDPAMEASLPISDISGLNNYILPRPHVHKLDAAASTTLPKTGSSPSGAYMGNDFRNAYVPGTSLTGAGQMVGLLQFDGFYQSDITAYEAAAGLPNVSIQTVLLDGYNGQPTSTGNMEVSLDIEMVLAMAPGVSKIVVFEAGPSGFPNDILNAMAANTQIKQFSSSWGWSGGAVLFQCVG